MDQIVNQFSRALLTIIIDILWLDAGATAALLLIFDIMLVRLLQGYLLLQYGDVRVIQTLRLFIQRFLSGILNFGLHVNLFQFEYRVLCVLRD